jgi:hypothetical protein
MTIEEAILERVRTLPSDNQSELPAVADSLAAETEPKASFRSLRGLWAEFDIDISVKDIQELRREMWKNFPREFRCRAW